MTIPLEYYPYPIVAMCSQNVSDLWDQICCISCHRHFFLTRVLTFWVLSQHLQTKFQVHNETIYSRNGVCMYIYMYTHTHIHVHVLRQKTLKKTEQWYKLICEAHKKGVHVGILFTQLKAKKHVTHMYRCTKLSDWNPHGIWTYPAYTGACTQHTLEELLSENEVHVNLDKAMPAIRVNWKQIWTIVGSNIDHLTRAPCIYNIMWTLYAFEHYTCMCLAQFASILNFAIVKPHNNFEIVHSLKLGRNLHVSLVHVVSIPSIPNNGNHFSQSWESVRKRICNAGFAFRLMDATRTFSILGLGRVMGLWG